MINERKRKRPDCESKRAPYPSSLAFLKGRKGLPLVGKVATCRLTHCLITQQLGLYAAPKPKGARGLLCTWGAGGQGQGAQVAQARTI